jgi:tRNA threonylcarbamoyladenosine biosynthesis protein TsaB
MLLLVTDTSGRQGSVALGRAASESDDVELIEAVPLAGGTFSAQLVPQISALLGNHGFRKEDIGAFVVVAGPGSFTGLRVGLAVIKALAEILQKPIVAVSLLEVMALGSHASGKILAAIDAGRGELYVGEYQATGDGAALVREMVLSKDEFFSLARECTAVVSDDGLAGAAREAGVEVSLVAAPNARAIALLGWRKLQAGLAVTPEQLEANYIRRTDAEILAKSGR